MALPPFEKFVKNPFKGRLITFDPGQTTGYSIWDNAKLIEAGQLPTYPVVDCVVSLSKWIDEKSGWKDLSPDDRHLYPVHCRIEEYRVYSWKTEDHAHSDIHTARLIGCLETLLTLRGIRYTMCGAGLAKQFTNADQPGDKLKDWGFWQRGQKHARDAIRHGVYFYCTPPK